VAAIALVAIVAQPIRRRLQVVADRIVYGRRATPYQVLSDLARNVAAADETLLDEVARSLVDGTSGERATIWVSGDGAMQPAATWPPGSPAEPGSGLTAQVTHDGEALGAIAVTYPINGEPTPNDQHLIDQVAAGIGLALRNIQLTDDLKRRVEDLRESRRRIVAVQDDTRRKLERDLHDGAQQHLVALKVKLGLAANLAKSKDLDKTSTLVAAMSGEADEAISSMRDFARGVYPPLLEAEGLSAAISAQARKLPLPVEVESVRIGRYSTEIESTIYFCVLESLQNAVKHSQAGQVQVRLEDHGDTIGFSVIDDGVGMAETAQGTGLINLSDRVDSVGGDLRVESAPGRGVAISAVIPKEMVDA
jgi:signal transduction histidine kinase